jgi:hypothetical protein
MLTHTPVAPHMRFAASPRESYTAPAPTTCTGLPVSGLMWPFTASTQAGMRMEAGTSPVCPPPSPACAQMRSTPISSAFGTCFGWPTICKLRVSTGLRGQSSRACRERQETYVHDGDASLVQALNDLLWRYTDGADEERRLLFDNDINELRKLALCVVILQDS